MAEEFVEVVFEGSISSIERNSDNGKVDLNIYVGEGFDYSIFDQAFKKSPKQYVPRWYSTKSGFVNLHSKYKIPALVSNNRTDTDKIIDTGADFHFHKCSVKVVIKQGATYPKAIKILDEVEENDYNPFEGM